MNILIKSAKIVNPQSKTPISQPQDILIENGTISKISKDINLKNPDKIIDLDNLYVSEGWFDSSVSLGEPGYEERETIENGLVTAAKSGFTGIALNPNTSPVVDSKPDIAFIKSRAFAHAVNVYPIGALTANGKGQDLAELYDMQKAGAVAFGDYQKPVTNPNLLKIALQYTQGFEGLVISFPLEQQIATKGMVNEGENATRLGLKGIPALAEELQIARDLFILEYTGGKLHIPTVSTAKSVMLIKEAKKKGLNISCSVSINHLFFDDSQLEEFDTNFKLLPPLRTKKDTKALLKGLEDGVIDFVTSNHNPIDIEHKKQEFDHAMYGSIGLESIFGALNSLAGLTNTIAYLTKGKNRFGIDNSGIREGEKANITLFNPDFAYTFNENEIQSTSKNSIFLNTPLKGKAYGIYANNQLVLND